MLYHEHEGLLRIAQILQPFERELGNYFGGITRVLGGFAVAVHYGVVILALTPIAGSDFEVIEAGGQ